MANFTEFINSLSAQTGLDKSVIAAWVSMEQGVNNNVLGITSPSARTSSNPHGLLTFATQTQAATATANLLKSSSMYSSIIASAKQSPSAQAIAIAKSPWHLGTSGIQQAGGIDTYYFSGFKKAGLVSGTALQAAITTPSINFMGIPAGPNAPNPVANLPGINFDIVGAVMFVGVILVGITLIASGALINLKSRS